MTDATSAPTVRKIDTSSFVALTAIPEPGPAPMLQWVKIADLVVDERYQRPIYGAGRINVRRIAEAFCWSKFAPLIVAPVAGGGFAIVDGQHRATAAALNGFESVPAQVIVASATEQADAFKAINGTVTKVSPLALHHAAVAAGDPGALEIVEVCAAAGVEIAPYPKMPDRMKPGETLALGAVRKMLNAFGRETVITALQCITETANAGPGVVSMHNILAISAVLGANHRWRDAGGALLAAFDEISLEEEHEEAVVTRRGKGVALWEVMSWRLADRLKELLPLDGLGEAAE